MGSKLCAVQFSWTFNFYNNWCNTLCLKLSKLLSKGFKRPVCWNKYKIIPNKTYDGTDYIRELLGASYQGVKTLFVVAYRDCGGANRVTADSNRRYFFPRVKIENYNIEIDGRNFYDQPINDFIKQFDEVRKVSTGQGDDYTTGCLSDFVYFKKNLQTNCSWFKQAKGFRCRLLSNSTDYFYW